MSVTDFECAIAKSQIGRYIAGENMAPEVARQLESHINNCDRCKLLLQERKNSLEAMINDEEDDASVISITETPIPMTRPSAMATDGSSALKMDYMEVLADNARRSLDEKVGRKVQPKTSQAEIPMVAPAFAYKEQPTSDSVIDEIESASKSDKKRFDLKALALFKNVPDEDSKPSLTADSIRSAKAVFRDNNPSLRKPTMYLAGLCCVVAAMSFILRDPTTLFGNKVAAKGSSPVVEVSSKAKPSTKVAKVLKHKPGQINDGGTDAQSFTNAVAPTKKKPAPKVNKVKVAAINHTMKPHLPKKTAAQHFAKAPRLNSPRVKAKPRTQVAHKVHKSTSTENVVKLYTPDQTPNTKEQK